MKKLLYLILFFLAFSKNTKSQIEDLIISYTDTTELIRNNGRRLLVQKITYKDYKTAKEIYKYLNEKTEFKTFGYFENLYINMLLHDWDTWIKIAKNYKKYTNTKVYNNTDKISKELYNLIIENSDIIEFSAKSSDMSEETKDVIAIFHYYLKNKTQDDNYNKMLNEFHSNYKSSEYNLFLQSVLPHISHKLSLGLSIGAASLFLIGNIEENITPSNLISIGTYANINKLFLSTNIHSGVFQLKNAFSTELENTIYDFAKGEYFIYTEIDFLIGYSVFTNKNLRITPFAKIAGSDLQKEYNASINQTEPIYILNLLTYGPGIHTELKLFEFGRKIVGNNHKNSYLSIMLDVGYNFNSRINIHELKGNSVFANLSLVFGAGVF